MSHQQNPDDTILLFGSTEPPRLFDEEPTIITFDLNAYFFEPLIDLKPFNTIANIINNVNTLNDQLRNFNRTFTVVFILPQWDRLQVQTFLRQNVLICPRVNAFYLFFINGRSDGMTALCGNKLAGCHPITSRISAQTRIICATVNDLSINYCEDQRLQNEAVGDIGAANAYAFQRQYRLGLQRAYNEQLRKEFEERLLG